MSLEKKIVFDILTPTTGNDHLEKLLVSLNELYETDKYVINHIIVIDGLCFEEKAQKILNKIEPSDYINRHVVQIPFNTGANNYLGHRIYASFVHLINGDYVIFLDEDNYFEPEHIENYYNLLKKRKKTNWLFSLRNIIDYENKFICKDISESIGNLHRSFYGENNHLIDTNCFCVSKDTAIKHNHIWNRKYDFTVNNSDRLYARTLMIHEKHFECTYKFTVNYRTCNRKESVTNNVFTKANEIINKIYCTIPWITSTEMIVIDYLNEYLTNKLIYGIYTGQITRYSPILINKILVNKYSKFNQYDLPVFTILQKYNITNVSTQNISNAFNDYNNVSNKSNVLYESNIKKNKFDELDLLLNKSIDQLIKNNNLNILLDEIENKLTIK
jgi:hypothetical protein